MEVEELLRKIINESEIKSLKIDVAFDTFMHFIKANRRQQTLIYYQYLVESLKKYFYDLKIFETKDIKQDTIERIIYRAKVEGNKNATINKKLACLKYALSYLQKNDFISLSSKLNFPVLEDDQERFKILEIEDLNYIIKNLNKFNVEQQLIFRLILITGIRRTELCYVELKNIDFENKTIYLSRTKNHKPRYIFFDDDCLNFIKLLKAVHKKYLLEDENNNQVMPRHIGYVFQHIKKDLNLKCSLSPHVLRHTFATALFSNDADMESIRLLLGHSDYTMLKKYIHINNERLQKVSLEKGPLSN